MSRVALKPKISPRLPEFLPFADPTLRSRPPNGPEWIHEIKWDGYRAQLHTAADRTKVYSRTGLEWTSQFAAIAQAARELQPGLVIDGEAVVIGSSGRADFQALRRELGNAKSSKLVFFAFDLLWASGNDLRRRPLADRKARLHELLRDAPENIKYLDHLTEDGAAVFAHACLLQLEGIVSKRLDSIYQGGRVDSWIKAKCKKSNNYPIIAFVEKLGASPRKIASLYVGRYEGEKLLYAGKVRSGYTEATARELRELLHPLIIKNSPLSIAVKKPKATWVRPEVQAEVQYSSLTDDGLLREAVFKGIRHDLNIPQVKSPSVIPQRAMREMASSAAVPRENILQLLPDAVVPASDQLKAYWKRVAQRALPYLGQRPLKLVRHVHSTTFYHKGKLPPVPSSVHQLRLTKREGGEGVRLWVDDLEGLYGLVDMGAVELHPWNAKVDDFEHADQIVLDLDPGEGIAWSFVTDTAFALREILTEEGLAPWPKLTGGKGIHLVAPLKLRMTHDAARQLAKNLAQRLIDRDPERYTLSAAFGKRTGRLFLDYLRNGRGTTAIGTYSPRARPQFPIAAPVSWKDVENGTAPNTFTISRLPRTRGRG